MRLPRYARLLFPVADRLDVALGWLERLPVWIRLLPGIGPVIWAALSGWLEGHWPWLLAGTLAAAILFIVPRYRFWASQRLLIRVGHTVVARVDPDDIGTLGRRIVFRHAGLQTFGVLAFAKIVFLNDRPNEIKISHMALGVRFKNGGQEWPWDEDTKTFIRHGSAAVGQKPLIITVPAHTAEGEFSESVTFVGELNVNYDREKDEIEQLYLRLKVTGAELTECVFPINSKRYPVVWQSADCQRDRGKVVAGVEYTPPISRP